MYKNIHNNRSKCIPARYVSSEEKLQVKKIYDMVIAIDAGKALDKFNSQLGTKVLSELEIKSNFLNMQKEYLQKILQMASYSVKNYKFFH